MAHSLIQKFSNHIDNNLPFLKTGSSIVALSGGLDSVVLAYLCKTIGLDMVFAHCNFKLRNEESDRDAKFVYALGSKLNVETFIENFDTIAYAKSNKCSIQVAARTLRYQWFKTLSLQLKCDYILTAHHADDNLETFFIHVLRGTGLEGLLGIPEVNANVIRPLLCFSRTDIMAYAKHANIAWREDSSNASVKYLRNKLRHEVIPILKGINPQLLQNFDKTISHLKASQSIINTSIHHISKHVIRQKGSQLYLDIEKIQNLDHPKAYMYEILKNYGFTEWDDVVNLLEANSGKFVMSEDWRLIKDRKELILAKKVIEPFKTKCITKNDSSIALPIGTLYIEKVDNTRGSAHSDCIYVDADTLQFPLSVRTKKEGDVFFPLGMKGRKKLSKYFKDEKLSLIEKEQILLICSEDAIVWVIGKRADQRFSVQPKSRNILKISLVLAIKEQKTNP
ncbi:MAG: tRNA lysidine(34) synthetase TilS [Flavobacteriaceae bacterium]|nr:tRNA lysidine(34) synthetase TilS [Flavobacteriaceae bacterium]